MASNTQLRERMSGSQYFRAKDDVEQQDNMIPSKKEESKRKIPRSLNERFGGKWQTFDGGGHEINQRDSSVSSDSENNLGQGTYCVRSDSDSGSDRKKWTKNPLVVRRIKRADKFKQAEKRLSETGSGLASKNRERFIYHSNEEDKSRTVRPDVGNIISKDSGCSRGSNKYQKLEEMRKKRLNLSVTSDEDNSCHTALPRSASGGRNFQVTSRETEPIPHTWSGRSHFVPHTAQTIHYAPSHLHASITNNIHQALTGSPQQTCEHVLVQTASPLLNTSIGLNRQFLGTTKQNSHSWQQTASPHIQPSSHASFNPQPYQSEPRQPSFRTPNTSSSQVSQAVCTPPPDITIHRFKTQVPLSSADSFHGSLSHTKPAITRISSQPVTASQNIHHSQTKESSTHTQTKESSTHIQTKESSRHKQEVSQPINVPPTSYQAPILQPIKPRDDQSRSTYLIPKLGHLNSNLSGHGDDSLDELVESNIQYLDSELDKAKTRRNAIRSVRNFSTLPDNRNMARATVISSLQQQPSFQVQTTSIQLHVSLPEDTQRSSQGRRENLLHMAPLRGVNLPVKYDNQLISQTVPRPVSGSALPRPVQAMIQYRGKENISKPVIQTFVPSIHEKHLSINAALTSDKKLRSDTEGSLCAPRTESGMFSDVEYNIEVSQRVKKWETFMKVKDVQPIRPENTITIHENMEGGLQNKDGEIEGSGTQSDRGYNDSNVSLTRPRLACSDSEKFRRGNEQTVPPVERNMSSQIIQHTQPLARSQVIQHTQPLDQSQSVNRAPFFYTNSITNDSELRQQIFTKHTRASTDKSAPMQTTNKSVLKQTTDKNAQLQATDKTLMSENNGVESCSQRDSPLFKRSSKPTEIPVAGKAASKYREELDEMSITKADSVVNLRRRFDTASTTSEDDQRSVSTASARLIRPSKELKLHPDSVDWSNVLPGYKTKIKDSDVWSPNLESTQGIPVSIERVTARTLQTIPFSEDPFWKEIEQMTSFDPTSTSGHLSDSTNQVNYVTDELVRSHHHHVELNPSQSFTLPNQPRNHVISVAERLQKSKSLYTPNVMPSMYTANVIPSLYTPNIVPSAVLIPSKAAVALDQVLKDINRSSNGGKQVNPEKSSLENDITPTKSSISNVLCHLKHQSATIQPKPTYEDGQSKFINIGTDLRSKKLYESGQQSQVRSETVASQSKQPTHIYPHSSTQHEKPQMAQGCVNNYQLDPNVLKQKLLSTGLVVDTDIEETVDRAQYQDFKQETSTPDKRLALNTTMPNKILTPSTRKSNKLLTPSNTMPNKILTPSTIMSNKILTPSTTMPNKILTPSTTMPNKILTSSTTTPFDTAVNLQSKNSSHGKMLFISSPSNLPGTTPVTNVGPSIYRTGMRPGTHTLDDIQKALTPFKSTSYQPNPETLYGASRLQSFQEPRVDTSRGVHTSATGWSYHRQARQDTDQQPTSDSSLSGPSSRLEQVNQRMDHLKNLARNVEERINVIKSKLGAADEESLESILVSLRQVAPQVKLHNSEPATFEVYYTTKKSKLSEALVELDRIYRNLKLEPRDLTNLPEIDDYNLCGSETSNFDALGRQPKSVHLRPMQTRISSMFIGGLDSSRTKSEAEEKESEFEVISKSLQAIVDEVNQTTDLLSRATARNREDNMAPEMQRQAFKVTVYPGNTQVADCNLLATTDVDSTSQSLPVSSHQTQEVKTTGCRFRPKQQECLRVEGSLNEIRTTSDCVPNLEPTTDDMLQTSLQNIKVKEMTNAEIPVSSSCSQATQQQARVRPVSDNKIIQNDRASQKGINEKVLRVSCSPQSSPTMFKKITAREFDVKLQPSQIAYVSSGKPAMETTTVELHLHNMEDQYINTSGQESSTSSHNNIISSTRSRGLEIPASDSNPSAQIERSLPLTSVRELDQALLTLQLTTDASMTTESSSSGCHHSSSSASTASMNLTPPVSESSQLRHGSKTNDSETTSSSEHMTKRQLGTGVALLLDKFNSGESIMRPCPSTRNGPDLDVAAPNDDDKKADDDLRYTQATDNRDNRSKFQQLQGQAKSSNKQTSLLPKLGMLSLDRNVAGQEAKAQSFSTSSPQHFSPVDKPPQSPWKRQISDPDKQSVNEAIKAGSPKFISKIPRPVSLNGSPASEGYFTPKETESPRQGIRSPDVVVRRVTAFKFENSSSQYRPRSFHELISCFEKDPQRLQSCGIFRKFASADEINSSKGRVSM